MSMSRLGAATLCLLLGVALGRELHDTVRPDDQHSQPCDPSRPDMPDIPLDQPPLKRTVKGYEPEGLHISPWQLGDKGWTMLVSWQTGEPRVGPTHSPPRPHDPTSVPARVRYGKARGAGPDALDNSVVGQHSLVYNYKYDTVMYQSPIIHHVLLEGLEPGATYSYSVGNERDGWSASRTFTVPGTTSQLPVKIGLLGDLGQTLNSTVTLEHLQSHDLDLIWHIGDLSYADDHCADDSGTYCPFGTDQRRWDSWARMTEPLYSRFPVMHIHGNHEVETQTSKGWESFAAYNARYPIPQDPSVLNTSPNYADRYLDVVAGSLRRFRHAPGLRLNNSYYSSDVPGAHLVALSTYLPYGRESEQYRWLLGDLAAVDRQRTPWLVVMFHASPRNNYAAHFKEVEEFMELYEPLFYQHRVDLVFSGHTHAYERTLPMLNYTVDWCAPMYICIGDGGNMEGLARTFVDAEPPEYCKDPQSHFRVPDYQPSPSGGSVINFQEGRFCPDKQPKWSAYRDPSFGHGLLTIHSATQAEWQWFRNQDGEAVSRDHVFIERSPDCNPIIRPAQNAPLHEA